jgi:hypothetical protein
LLFMAPAVGGWAVKTDHWFYGLFQSAPDLITLLLPAAGAAPSSLPADSATVPPAPTLAADAPGDALYRYCFAEALRL